LDEVVPGTSINWERTGWTAEQQKGIWGCCSTAGSIGASSIPWQPREQTPSWDASNTAQSASQRTELSGVFSVGAASPQVLCAVLGPTISEGS